MVSKIKWLTDVEKVLDEMGGDDLFFLLELMYEETYYDFIYFISEASIGEGMSISETIEYALEDLDDPPEFHEARFLVGDHLSTTMTHKHFVKLVQVISDSYVKANPEDKALIEYYMSKLKARYK